MGHKEKSIEIVYFAALREERGASQDVVQTVSQTARDLYLEIKAFHGFSFSLADLHVAINQRFSSWDTALEANDQVVFIPPVSGG